MFLSSSLPTVLFPFLLLLSVSELEMSIQVFIYYTKCIYIFFISRSCSPAWVRNLLRQASSQDCNKALLLQDLSPEELFKANVLGWCIEWVSHT